ncbi:hypothetical protein N7492_000303 [Penicillium capsulatum]|uniref:COP9 signalosome complex subunit 6 n=1 Tax=Penicillium capsulatum TaxID=69766 RepID=A0A9W9IRG9_9EURO|nr:hypothetical protein N7492_000303 [Penicillium capsulatum]KAJ6130633.1 hypothetical protein N7512_003413 [Penicillium capsulatum]
MDQSLLSQKASDSGLHIQLHPLVLLTISDHITRHAARQQQGPILGILLGQQNGREITLEHAFECPTANGPNNEPILPNPWFDERLKQFKDVHKDPALDLVGWWSTASPSGPDASQLPIHRQLLQDYNESAVFLAFHPSQLAESESHKTKLPLTVYETVFEGENAGSTAKDMQIDGEEPTLNIRFRDLPYSVETGEAEMIGMDTIAKSSGTASWNQPTAPGAGASKKEGETSSKATLTQDEEELISNLSTRLNAIRTLQSRISLIKSYVASVAEPSDATAKGETSPPLSHPVLRNINALLAHLYILSPDQQSPFSAEVLSQSNDVLLVSLLGQLGENVRAMRELGTKMATIQHVRTAKPRQKGSNLMQSRYEQEMFSLGSFGGYMDDSYSENRSLS